MSDDINIAISPASWNRVVRERDEAIRQRDETNESSVFSCNFYYEEKLKAERERDEAREDLDEEKKFHHRTHAELIQTQCKLLDMQMGLDEAREECKALWDMVDTEKKKAYNALRERDEAIQEREGWKMQAEQKWGMRRELEELLGVKDTESDKQFAKGLAALRDLIQERDEAREQAARLNGAYEDATNYYERMIDLIDERDKAREALAEEMKFHHRAHSELIQTQCKLLDMQMGRDEAREELRTAVQERHDFHWELQDAIRERNEAREQENIHHDNFLFLQREAFEMREAIIATLEENRHLADGDDCTLAKLKSVVPDWK